ncbi:MAG: hypothetical protein FWG89_03610 [Treponema sp.]|nr:hypothetical protein [Treponema sp.]
MKKLLVVVFLILVILGCSNAERDGRLLESDREPQPDSGSAFAQMQNAWWHTLERGKVMFRQGDYGSALLTFDDARRQRRAIYERKERSFIEFLSLGEVRRLGDDLNWIDWYIQERQFTVAADVLNDLYYHIPRDTLRNSATEALTALGSLKDYPEAEYWIGETYYIQGELTLALNQFQKAYDLRHLLENPGFASDLLFKIAAIRQIRQEYNEMERVLLAILSNDILWSGSPATVPASQPVQASQTQSPEQQARNTFTVQAMTRTLENNGINRFINQFRYSYNESVQAHRILGEYYFFTGRHARAQEHLMFAFLIQNTVIIDELNHRRFDFSTTTVEGESRELTLEVIADEISRDVVFSHYAENNEYFKTAYYLGTSLFATGRIAPAREIWNFLAAQDQAGEWQGRAQSQLISPRVERGLEMP